MCLLCWSLGECFGQCPRRLGNLGTRSALPFPVTGRLSSLLALSRAGLGKGVMLQNEAVPPSCWVWLFSGGLLHCVAVASLLDSWDLPDLFLFVNSCLFFLSLWGEESWGPLLYHHGEKILPLCLLKDYLLQWGGEIAQQTFDNTWDAQFH